MSFADVISQIQVLLRLAGLLGQCLFRHDQAEDQWHERCQCEA